MFDRLSIRTQILASIVIFALLSLGVNSAISMANLDMVRDNTRDLATEAIKEQITDNLKLSASETSKIIERKLVNAQAVVEALVTATEQLFSDNSSYKYRESYFDLQVPPDARNDDRYNRTVSFDHSTYYLPGFLFNLSRPDFYRPYLKDGDVDDELRTAFESKGHPLSDEADMSWNNTKKYGDIVDDGGNYTIVDMGSHLNVYRPITNLDLVEELKTPAINETINRSVQLDYWFKPLMEQNPDIIWLYMGFEEGRMFRGFPGTYTGLSPEDRSFDPTVRPWYTGAENAPKGTHIITEPYDDAAGQGLMISLAKAVYMDDELLGVVSADLLLRDIKDIVENVTFLETGYAALVQNNGKVLAHQKWDPNPDKSTESIVTIDALEPINISSTANSPNLFAKITSPVSGVETYVRDNQTHYLAHAPVLDNYTFFISVPQNEAVALMSEIDNNIEQAQNRVSSTAIRLSILTFLLVLGLGLWLGNSIATPIENLSKSTLHISRSATKPKLLAISEEAHAGKEDEIAALTRSFSKMVDSLWY